MSKIIVMYNHTGKDEQSSTVYQDEKIATVKNLENVKGYFLTEDVFFCEEFETELSLQMAGCEICEED